MKIEPLFFLCCARLRLISRRRLCLAYWAQFVGAPLSAGPFYLPNFSCFVYFFVTRTLDYITSHVTQSGLWQMSWPFTWLPFLHLFCCRSTLCLHFILLLYSLYISIIDAALRCIKLVCYYGTAASCPFSKPRFYTLKIVKVKGKCTLVCTKFDLLYLEEVKRRQNRLSSCTAYATQLLRVIHFGKSVCQANYRFVCVPHLFR